MAKLSVAAWIGNAAAVLCGRWGAVSGRAKEVGCSRQTVYEHAARVQRTISDQQDGGADRETLARENEQLRRENQELWEALEGSIDFPEAKQQQFVVTASAMGLSLRQILSLLAIVLPSGQCPSRATLGRWVAHWSRRAGEVLRVLDGVCQKLVLVLCLDEIFFRRTPVLVGVQPQSMAWVVGQEAENRNGETWCETLRPWERLEYAVADGGSGLRKGLSLIQEARQQDPQAPDLEIGLDVFHIKKEALPVIHRMWRRAESLWEKAEAADRERERCRQQGKHAYLASGRARAAWRKAEKAFWEADRVEAAWKRAEQALGLFRPDGELNDRAWAQAEIAAAIAQLSAPEWAKVRRMLSDPYALTFLDRMHRQLRQAEPNDALREAVAQLWWLRRQAPSGPSDHRRSVHAACVVQTALCERIDPTWRQAYHRVGRVLLHTVRASSVVECMNSVIRMHQARHRTLTQPMLDLKRLWWNCRPFREGKRRHRCPYQHLGLGLPTYDFWHLLQLDPQELAQKVSTAELTI